MRVEREVRWFTGNIGCHHVHHLKPTIPFYRLPEAMAVIPELQQPVDTTLRPGDVLASLRLKLWDPERHKMVGCREAVPSGYPSLPRDFHALDTTILRYSPRRNGLAFWDPGNGIAPVI